MHDNEARTAAAPCWRGVKQKRCYKARRAPGPGLVIAKELTCGPAACKVQSDRSAHSPDGKIVPRLSKRYSLGGAALAAVIVLPAFVRRDDLAWELAQLAGYLSALGCLFLIGASLRPRDSQPPKLLTLDQHKWLAWVSVALLGAHIGGTLLIDPHTVEYLKPSMPAYQLAGLLATLTLVLASVTALARARRVLWKKSASFRAVHILLAALIGVLIFVHVVATDRYATGSGRWLWTALTVLVLMLPLQRVPQGTSRWPVAFRYHARQISFALALGVIACLGLAAQSGERRAKLTLETFVPRAQSLPIEFPHEQHGSVNCIACHHNFVDRSGVDNCVPCHRSERSDLRMGAQARFHAFCMDCHRNDELPVSDRDVHGPVSRCSACHRPLLQGTAK